MPEAIHEHPLRPFLYPRSIVVVGASSEARKAGGRRWLSLVREGYSGPIYPVTRRAGELDGHRTFQSLDELPQAVELAIIMVPAQRYWTRSVDAPGPVSKLSYSFRQGLAKLERRERESKRRLPPFAEQPGFVCWDPTAPECSVQLAP
ncbi:MAG: CoA-binding domain protein [Burkholderiales bacterium]|nr:CoA-binding domain protein [Burkholderiales bacterium]